MFTQSWVLHIHSIKCCNTHLIKIHERNRVKITNKIFFLGEEGWWTCPMNSRRCMYYNIYPNSIHTGGHSINASLWKQWNTSQNSRVHFRLQQKCVSSRKMYKIIISKQDIELGYCVSNLSARSYTHIRNTYRIITKKANISLMRCRGHSHTFSFRMYKNITFDIVYALWISFFLAGVTYYDITETETEE